MCESLFYRSIHRGNQPADQMTMSCSYRGKKSGNYHPGRWQTGVFHVRDGNSRSGIARNKMQILFRAIWLSSAASFFQPPHFSTLFRGVARSVIKQNSATRPKSSSERNRIKAQKEQQNKRTRTTSLVSPFSNPFSLSSVLLLTLGFPIFFFNVTRNFPLEIYDLLYIILQVI